jgi:nucleoside-diphosphate-sugar epimerase
VKIFLAGATGAVGRPLVKLLVAGGHEVVGVTRRWDRANWLEEVGAEAVIGDAFDEEWLRDAVRRSESEVVIDQMTDLPQRIGVRGMRRFYRGQNPLRTKASGALLRAAEDARARRVISQSVAFIYAPDGGGVKSEQDAIWADAPEPFGNALRTAATHDEKVVGLSELEGVVLRYGVLYGPGTHFAKGNGIYNDVRWRRFPIVGNGESVWSFCHVEDAARAAVAALDAGNAGIYNVVDDEPARARDWIPRYAELIGAARPYRVPRWLARIFAGPAMTAWGTSFPGSSNRKAKLELGWEPLHRSWYQGFAMGAES